MADRMYASIHIPECYITDEVLGWINEECLEDDGENGGIHGYHEDQATWGEFSDLERFLVGKGIPFDRFCEGEYEHLPEWRAYRPNIGMDAVMVTDEAMGAPMIEVPKIRRILAQEDIDHLTAIRELLEKEAPEVPPLK